LQASCIGSGSLKSIGSSGRTTDAVEVSKEVAGAEGGKFAGYSMESEECFKWLAVEPE
jgi:hypothetical protein